MTIINRNVPKIDPCGIPLKTLAQLENSPVTITLCFQSDRKFVIHSIILLCILYDLSLLISRLCGTL